MDVWTYGLYGQKWTRMDKNGRKWTKMDENGRKWTKKGRDFGLLRTIFIIN